MSSLKRITGPAAEPVSVTDQYAYMRQDDTSDDSFLQILIATARDLAERYTNRAFFNQTWELSLDVPDGRIQSGILSPEGLPWTYVGYYQPFIELPRAPLVSITSVTSYGLNDSQTVMMSTKYRADTGAEPGRILLNSGQSWPTDLRPYDALVIRYVCGYGATASVVPEGIRMAIMQAVATMYENRTVTDELDPVSKRMLDKYRVISL